MAIIDRRSFTLYCKLHQIIAGGATGKTTLHDIRAEDFIHRAVHIHAATNCAFGDALSHITVEFAGIRAKFLTFVLFDGSGPYGTGLAGVAMPKVKLPAYDRAMVALSVLDFLVSADVLPEKARAFYGEKIAGELSATNNLLRDYASLCRYVDHYLDAELATETKAS